MPARPNYMTSLRWCSSKMQPHWVSTSTNVESIDLKLQVNRPSKTKLMIKCLRHAFSWILSSCLVHVWCRKKWWKWAIFRKVSTSRKCLKAKTRDTPFPIGGNMHHINQSQNYMAMLGKRRKLWEERQWKQDSVSVSHSSSKFWELRDLWHLQFISVPPEKGEHAIA